jgi:hypothetical protein
MVQTLQYARLGSLLRQHDPSRAVSDRSICMTLSLDMTDRKLRMLNDLRDLKKRYGQPEVDN